MNFDAEIDFERENIFELQTGDIVFIKGEIYRLERMNRGGMGLILLMTRIKDPTTLNTLGQNIALKMLLPEFDDPIGKSLFKRELTIWAGLQHPNIVRLSDILDSKCSCMIAAMRWWSGSLRDLMRKRNSFTIKECEYVIENILSGLEYAYDKDKIIHLDIKPENILYQGSYFENEHEDLLKYNLKFMIGDWGISSIKNSQLNTIAGDDYSLVSVGKTFNNMGTCCYMAPERFSKGVTSSISSDVYSLGMIYFEMLTGELPFNNKNNIFPDLYSRNYLVIAKNALLKKGIRKSISDFIVSMIEFEIKNRPQTYCDLHCEFIKSRKASLFRRLGI